MAAPIPCEAPVTDCLVVCHTSLQFLESPCSETPYFGLATHLPKTDEAVIFSLVYVDDALLHAMSGSELSRVRPNSTNCEYCQRLRHVQYDRTASFLP